MFLHVVHSCIRQAAASLHQRQARLSLCGTQYWVFISSALPA
jgi:hypothetical protein